MSLEMQSGVRKEILAADRDELAGDGDEDLEKEDQCVNELVLPHYSCLVQHFEEHGVVIDQKGESPEVVDSHSTPAKPVNPFNATQEILLGSICVLYQRDLHPHR
jgi:hypothetical protein